MAGSSGTDHGLHAVRAARRGDVRAIAQVLARAFDDDPLAGYLLPQPTRRPRGLRTFFTIELRAIFLPRGNVSTTEERAGAAIWAPPGMERRDLGDMVHLLPMLLHMRLRDLNRPQRLFARLDEERPAYPHWYLATLGTEPRMQGRGIGSALLEPVLRHCDEQGIPAYLESSKKRNVPFYRRHGWEVVRELRVESGAPPIWPMLREPRPPER